VDGIQSVSAGDDIEAIRQLKARYFRTMDTKDWDGFLSVFVPDVMIDMTGEGGTRTEGATDFVATVRSSLENAVTVHHGHMPEIQITSATTADGVWAMEDHLWWPEGSAIRHLHGYGHYHETYEKTADGWRISSLALSRLHRDFVLPE
jgi:uncharacterized protein (TIGR02246 family)